MTRSNRKIELDLRFRKKIARTFGVTMQSVGNALGYDSGKGQTDLAKRIRMMALEHGGRHSVTWLECETIHNEATGYMVQTFDNGAKLVMDKHTGDAEVLDPKGVVRMRRENILVREIYVLQKYAAAF